VNGKGGGFSWFTTNDQVDAVFARIDSALWYSTGGPFTNISAGIGGTAVEVFQTPSRDFIWAGSDAGVWVSYDRGGTWQARNAGLTCLNVVHAVVSNTGTMYAASTCNQVDAVFRSFDRGLTWRAMPALPGAPKISRMNRSANATSSTVFVYTSSGSYHAVDTSTSWTLRENPASTLPPRNIPPTADIIEEFQTLSSVCVTLVRNVGPYRAENCLVGATSFPAETLQRQGLPTVTAFGNRIGLVNNELLIPILGDGMYRFDRTSGSWVRVYSDSQLPGIWYVRDIIAGSSTLFASSLTSGIWRSVDSGTTWQPFGLANATPPTPVVVLNPITPLPQTAFIVSTGQMPAAAVTSVDVSSDTRSLTVSVQLDLAKILGTALAQTFAATSGYSVYVVALVPGERLGAAVGTVQFFQHPADGSWGALTSPLAAFVENVAVGAADQRVRVEILRSTDVTGLVGAEIYIGYGTSDTEMLAAGRYRGVYKVQ
jgi:hypothetical protein